VQLLLLALSLSSGLFSNASANSAGKTGVSTTGCSCHGSADATTSASFSAPSTTVAPGESLLVSFTVASTSGSRTSMGLNVSATGGTLTAGTATRVSSSEITHSSRTAMSSGPFTFTWTAPTTPGIYTLRGVGNAVNGNSGSSGDGWNYASNLTINVVCSDGDSDGVTDCDGDCDDGNNLVFPGASETCDGADNDCDGTIDDSPIDGDAYYADTDGDGYGAGSSVLSCSAVTGRVANNNDCNDGNVAINPDANEVCDGSNTDEDCNGLADNLDAGATGGTNWFRDDDNDGYGDGSPITACDAPTDFVADDGDCDDESDATYPGAPESCEDAEDHNCDGSPGNLDADGDGYASCEECNDSDLAVNPGATETCNGFDDNCDGISDGADAADALTWYADNDGDGFGNPEAQELACEAPEGFVEDASDCDDNETSVNPESEEIWYDGTDQNCDENDMDQDGDGVEQSEDCDDTDPELAEDCGGEDGTDGGTDGADGSEGSDGSDGSSSEDPEDKEPGCSSAPAPGMLVWPTLLALPLLLRRRKV
jgi:uncharacterized protein (TIGR03382 family)